MEKRKIAGKGRQLTRKDLRKSATRNAASMISNYSDLCAWVGWAVYRESEEMEDGQPQEIAEAEGGMVRGKVCVRVEERLYQRDRRFSHPQPIPQPHLPKTRHPRPQQHNHADAGRKHHVAAQVVAVRLMTRFTPQLFPSNFAVGNCQDDPQTTDAYLNDGSRYSAS